MDCIIWTMIPLSMISMSGTWLGTHETSMNTTTLTRNIQGYIIVWWQQWATARNNISLHGAWYVQDQVTDWLESANIKTHHVAYVVISLHGA